jgi:hypothetical protein
MRERLRKLIYKSDILCDTCGESTSSYCAEALANYLLANGVIVPPCKRGDTVVYPHHQYYEDGEFKPYELTVEKITVRQYFDSNFAFECDNGFVFRDTDIGKTVFLTREEAEKALAEREGKR